MIRDCEFAMQPLNQNSKLSLSEALRSYWVNLIGVAVFPFVFFIGGGVFHFPFLVIAPLFFVLCGLACWPVLTRRAPYSFWIVACGIWTAAGFLAFLALVLFKIVKAFVA